MPREIERGAMLHPVRTVDFSGFQGTRWPNTKRIAPTMNAPFAGLGALPGPSGPCTANQTNAERVMSAWLSLWDEVVKYEGLSKLTRDRIWQMFQAAEVWFDSGFSSGGIWCATKEDLAKHAQALEQAKGAFEAEVAAKGLSPTEAKTSPTARRVELPEERITARANWWGLTVGVAAAALAAVTIARRQSRGLSGVDSDVRRFRRRYGRA